MLHTDHIHSYIVVPACPGMATKHTGLPQKCSKMFPVPLRLDKFQNCFRWLCDYGPCGRFWAWDVGCISFFVGKDLFTAWKNAFRFRTGRKKLQVKLCFFLERSPVLEATTNPETTGISQPGSRSPGELAISRALGDLLLKNQGLGLLPKPIRIWWELVFHLPTVNQRVYQGSFNGTQFGGDQTIGTLWSVCRVCPSLQCLGG